MNWEQIRSRWSDLVQPFREKFTRLTEDDLEGADGGREHLSRVLQSKYGHTEEEAGRHLENWRNSRNWEKDVPTSTSGDPTY